MVANTVVTTSGRDAYSALPNRTNDRWIKDPGLRRLNVGIALMFTSAAANGYDGSLMNGLLTLPLFMEDLGDINSNLLGLIIAGVSLGGTPSFIPASYFADGFGRKKCVALGSAIMVCASIIQAATNGHWAFFGTRLMMGIGLGFAQTAAPPLTTEIAHPRQRGTITAIFQSTWYCGAVLSAVITLATLYLSTSWSWRIPCLMQAFFPLLQLFGLLIVPESPRWLVSKGRREEALEILARYHANGDQTDELVQFEFREICEAIEFENAVAEKSGWASFFSTRGAIHRLIICVLVGFMIQWAGNGIVSYYLAPILNTVGITSSSQQAGINLALQAWNGISAVGGAFATEKYGRRPLWLTSTALMFVFFALVTALSGVFSESHIKAAGSASVAMLFLFFGSYAIAYTPLSIAYPVEILPFHLRAKGLSLCLTVVFAAGFFNQYVNPIAFAALAWKFYFVYVACLAVFFVLIYFLFPETKGRSLEEIAVVFDGPAGQINSGRSLAVRDARLRWSMLRDVWISSYKGRPRGVSHMLK
ncbi:general substrate transporter [Aspergillus cavernicola]|uniref:General substrate transporter n=1 Tax=Aspergillus cavernicola TaxID=176166 RepID=A0ABR4HTJ5_9EURO